VCKDLDGTGQVKVSTSKFYPEEDIQEQRRNMIEVKVMLKNLFGIVLKQRLVPGRNKNQTQKTFRKDNRNVG
jgi:hypothetical protein